MAPVATVDVNFEERYWYPDDGGQVWLAGFQVVDPATGRWIGREGAELAAAGLRIVAVAGAARHHRAALDSDEVAPGWPLTLRRDPANLHDPNAIAVDTAGGEQVGWVPRAVAAALAPELDAGRPLAAVALRELRPSPRDPRIGLTMLIATADSIALREQPATQ